MSKERYKSKERIHDKSKLLCNKIFTNLSSENKGKCLILDAETFQTTEMLHKKGINYSDIFIPNPYAFEDMIKKAPKDVKIYDLFLGELLRGNYVGGNPYLLSYSINNAWFDYCGEFNGNEVSSPKKDIHTYFERRIPYKGVFAITIKTSRQKKRNPYEDIFEADCYIQQEALNNNYILIKVNQILYNHGMCFMIYKVIIRDGEEKRKLHSDKIKEKLKILKDSGKKLGRPELKIDRESVMNLRRQHKSIRTIAKELNVSSSYIHMLIHS